MRILHYHKLKKKRHAYSRTTFAISYGLSFASITATLTHTFLYFRKQIWIQSRRAMHEQPDIHARLMTVYRQVPEWWYACIFGEWIHIVSWRLTRKLTESACLSFFYLRSHYVRVWYHQYPTLACTIPRVGVYTFARHRYVHVHILKFSGSHGSGLN